MLGITFAIWRSLPMLVPMLLRYGPQFQLLAQLMLVPNVWDHLVLSMSIISCRIPMLSSMDGGKIILYFVTNTCITRKIDVYHYPVCLPSINVIKRQSIPVIELILILQFFEFINTFLHGSKHRVAKLLLWISNYSGLTYLWLDGCTSLSILLGSAYIARYLTNRRRVETKDEFSSGLYIYTTKILFPPFAQSWAYVM